MVDTENPRLHIVGHWNYEPGVVKPVYVVSNTDSVALFLNGKIMEQAQRDYHFLFTFDKIAFTPGVLEAVGYNDGKEVARMQLRTAGKPAKLKLSAIQNPKDGKPMEPIWCCCKWRLSMRKGIVVRWRTI